MAELFDWFMNENENNAFSPPDGAPENQVVWRQVNDIIREHQAVHARNFSDVSGKLTSSGIGGAYKIAPARKGISTYFPGLTFLIFANHASPNGGSTLEIDYTGSDGIGVKPITKRSGGALVANDISANAYFLTTYNPATDSFQLLSEHYRGISLDEILVGDANGVFQRRNYRELTIPAIGSVQFFTIGTNPAIIFGGGVWTQIGQGRFIMGAGTHTDTRGEQRTFVAGQADAVGEYQHVSTLGETAAHSHQILGRETSSTSIGSRPAGTIGSSVTDWDTTTVGGGAPHNNMPPSLVLNIWERTA